MHRIYRGKRSAPRLRKSEGLSESRRVKPSAWRLLWVFIRCSPVTWELQPIRRNEVRGKRKNLQEANWVLCAVNTIKVRRKNSVTVMTSLMRIIAPLTFSLDTNPLLAWLMAPAVFRYKFAAKSGAAPTKVGRVNFVQRSKLESSINIKYKSLAGQRRAYFEREWRGTASICSGELMHCNAQWRTCAGWSGDSTSRQNCRRGGRTAGVKSAKLSSTPLLLWSVAARSERAPPCARFTGLIWSSLPFFCKRNGNFSNKSETFVDKIRLFDTHITSCSFFKQEKKTYNVPE